MIPNNTQKSIHRLNKVLAKNRIIKENYFLLIFILFISADANLFEIHFVMFILLFICALIIFVKRGLELQLNIILFICIYLSSLLFYYLDFGWIDVLLSLRMLMIFLLGYMAARILQSDIFILYEKIIFILSIISLIFFVIQLLFFNELYNLVCTPQHFFPFMKFSNGPGGNIFIFTVQAKDIAGTRNAGFAWEPKGFGNFLIIAIISNVIHNKFKLNKKLIIFIITTITTFSTTAYINLFFLIPIFYLLNINKVYIVLFIPLIILLTYIVLQIDFMQKKILSEWKGRYEYKTLLSDSRIFEARSLGRVPGMIVDFKDFEKKPIWGYGLQRKERTQSIYTKLVRVNGLSDWLTTFGIVGFIFLILSYFIGFKKYLYAYDLKGAGIIVLIIMVIYFASNLITHPYWITLQFLFVNNYTKSKTLN